MLISSKNHIDQREIVILISFLEVLVDFGLICVEIGGKYILLDFLFLKYNNKRDKKKKKIRNYRIK